jgi:hypothetical protein
MSQTQRPPRSPAAWPALIFCSASLCFSLWVAVYHTPPQTLLGRYGLVLLGVGIVAGTAANLLASPALGKKSLVVFMWICFEASLDGVYLRAR